MKYFCRIYIPEKEDLVLFYIFYFLVYFIDLYIFC